MRSHRLFLALLSVLGTTAGSASAQTAAPQPSTPAAPLPPLTAAPPPPAPTQPATQPAANPAPPQAAAPSERANPVAPTPPVVAAGQGPAVLAPPGQALPPGAGGPDITSLRILRDKGIISQAEYDSAVAEMVESAGQRAGKSTTFVAGKWATTLYGFAEADYIYDSTQGLVDIPGAPLIPRAGTYTGDHPRSQFSVRNSRLGLRFGAPEFHCIRASALFESDFVVQTAPIAYTAPVYSSENNFFTNSVLRIRHFYLKVETPIFDVLFGQTWHLFGWQSAYHPSTDQPQGVPGELYSRTPQIRISKTFKTDDVTFDIAVAAMRPPERDGAIPEGEAGLHFAYNKWTAAQTMGSTGSTVSPLSVAVTGDLRQFALPDFAAKPDPYDQQTLTTSAIAFDAFVPVIPGTEKDKGNSLSLLGEYATGYGIPDMYSGLGSGVTFPALPNPTKAMPAPAYAPDIDPGYVTYDGNGRLHGIQYETARVGLQYYLPGLDGKMWISGNYSRLSSNNAVDYGTTRSAVLGHLDWFDANVFGDLTPAFRLGLEYANYNTMYADAIHAINHRVFASAFFIF